MKWKGNGICKEGFMRNRCFEELAVLSGMHKKGRHPRYGERLVTVQEWMGLGWVDNK